MLRESPVTVEAEAAVTLTYPDLGLEGVCRCDQLPPVSRNIRGAPGHVSRDGGLARAAPHQLGVGGGERGDHGHQE